MRALPIVLLSTYTQYWKDSAVLFLFTMTIWLTGYILFPQPVQDITSPANYCEDPRIEEKVLQPADSWSCIFYVLIGCYTLFHEFNNDFLVKQIRGAKLIFAFTMYLLAFGSFWFHSRLTLESSYLDTAGIMAFIGMAMAISFAKWTKSWVFYPVFVFYNIASMLFIYAMQETMGLELSMTAYALMFGVVVT